MGDEATRDIERTLDEIAAAATLAGGRVDRERLRSMPLGEALGLLYPNGVRLRAVLPPSGAALSSGATGAVGD